MIELVHRQLPPDCYSKSPLVPRGILLHHISAKNTLPAAPYDPEHCYKIFISYRVSAHYMVLRDGAVWNLVPEFLQAWHAGKSRFRGLTGLNQYFIGIELIGSEDDDFTDAQYESAAALCRDLMAKYRIPSHMITGHEIVSDERVRPDPKHDPGQTFDWVRFGGLVMAR